VLLRRARQPGWLTWAAFLSIAWFLVNWWPHDNLHRVNGQDFGGLPRIEYAFHLTLEIAGALLALYFFRWGDISEEVYRSEKGPLEELRAELEIDTGPQPTISREGLLDAWDAGDPVIRREPPLTMLVFLHVDDGRMIGYSPRRDRAREVIGLIEAGLDMPARSGCRRHSSNLRRSRSVEPILDRQSRNALEMTDITSNQGQSVGQSDRCYAEVGLIEPPSGRFEPGPERTVYLSGILIEGQD
jgi:hypothetical protein